jgi:hypothetical protein
MEERQKRFDEILDEWDEKRNGDPKNYSVGSGKKVFWVCRKNPCGCHKWRTTLYSRTGTRKTGCPYCKSRRLCPHNNFLAVYPILCEEWNYGMNQLSPENYSISSHKKVFWKCKKENTCECHVWSATINSRTSTGKSGCPFCKGKKLCPHNNLLAIHPELCKEWHYDKNPFPPESYSPSSGKKIFWKCQKENTCECHVWYTSVAHRTETRGRGCPYCKSNRVCTHNNLLTNYPTLCKEWDYEKNILTPEKCTQRSNKRVWWFCLTNPQHKWKTIISGRTSKSPRGCPMCNFSKGESAISNYLTSHKIEFVAQKKFDDCIAKKRLPFDFYLSEYNTLIEFDGVQHFENRNFFHKGRETFENRVYKDKLKLQFCLENKITLLRIAYEEIDIVNFILDVVIYNHLNNPFLFDLKNKLSEKTICHYSEQYEEVCLDNNIPLCYE